MMRYTLALVMLVLLALVPGNAIPLHAEEHCHDKNCHEAHHGHEEDSGHSPADDENLSNKQQMEQELEHAMGHGSHDHKNCQTCNDYWSEPWRSPEQWITWMKIKSGKIALCIFCFYIYLKRKWFLKIASRKPAR